MTKDKILERIAMGDVDTFLEEFTENMKPDQMNLVYSAFKELVAELHAEGRIEDYDLTPPFMGTSVPMNLKLKR